MCFMSPQPQCHVHPPCWDGLWKGKNCRYCPLSQYCRSLSDNIFLIVQYNVEEGHSYILSGRLCQSKVCECIFSTSEASIVCIWSKRELNSGLRPTLVALYFVRSEMGWWLYELALMVHTPASIWFLLLKWNFFLIDCRRCTAVLSSVWQPEIVYTCALGSYESKCWNASPQIRWSIHSVLITLSYLHGVIYTELSTRSYLHGVIYMELSTYTVNQTYQ